MNKKNGPKLKLPNIRDWGKVSILLLEEVVVLAVVVLILYLLGIPIPFKIIIIVGVVVGVLIFVMYKFVIPSFHKKQVTGREGMIGMRGRVVKPLTPVGAVMVKGEYWEAESVQDDIDVDESVEIVGIDGLLLKVKREGS